ncbi:hypothetical protein MTP03_06260 [Tsukamurella sp. PLM1]|nr:hypothetical protein MTP03_06260 [Tsukamurella sp. PLM1]
MSCSAAALSWLTTPPHDVAAASTRIRYNSTAGYSAASAYTPFASRISSARSTARLISALLRPVASRYSLVSNSPMGYPSTRFSPAPGSSGNSSTATSQYPHLFVPRA